MVACCHRSCTVHILPTRPLAGLPHLGQIQLTNARPWLPSTSPSKQCRLRFVVTGDCTLSAVTLEGFPATFDTGSYIHSST